MKLIVNHKGEQSLIITKPDAAVLKKARGLLCLAATYFGFETEEVGIIKELIDRTVPLASKESVNEQSGLLEAGEGDPPAVG